MTDALVIGAGPNGLVAANLLADCGWDVTVLEAQPVAGGGVQSSEFVERGFVSDHCSAFYPLTVASPAMTSLRLEEYGLRWRHAPLVLAHPTEDDGPAVLSRDVDETAESLDANDAGDGDEWRALIELWSRYQPSLVDALLTPFPPVRAGLGLVRRAGSLDDVIELARMGVLPVRRLGQEHFEGSRGRRLLAGLALHADLFPESALGGFFGWLLAGLGQHVGFPVPEGGAAALTDALVKRLKARGGRVVCDARAVRVVVTQGAAVAVELADGSIADATRAIIADTDAVTLYTRLLREHDLGPRFRAKLGRFSWDHATVKIDWTLDAAIPWSSEASARAGNVHVANDVDELTRSAASLSCGSIPRDPFLIVGQPHVADATRQPPGTATPWAYTHVPRSVRGDDGSAEGTGRIRGVWDAADVENFAQRVEARIEALAPGFQRLIRRRHVTTPQSFEAHDANMSRGSINLGTAELYQQLVFRPVPGLGRAETPVARLYLGSASAHPGGGVHGACGANAAHAALAHDRFRRARRVFRLSPAPAA